MIDKMSDQKLDRSQNEEFYNFKFPVGFQEFHIASYLLAFNFQLNRYYTLGWLTEDTIRHVSAKISDFFSWKHEMSEYAKDYEDKKRFKEAAILYRAAEFYTNPSDPEKKVFYNKFIDLFNKAFNEEPFERFKIPYQNGFLSTLRLTPREKSKGVLLFHGGFDSFIEELYPIATYFANNGHEIIMFEGPGQGYPLYQCGIKMDPKWERPTKAILDYFNLKDVTLIGMSLGGFLAARAAAFESRISRVVLWGVIYDLMGQIKFSTRLLIKFLLKIDARNFTNSFFERSISKRSPNDPSRIHSEWFFSHALFNTGCDTVFDYFKEAFDNYHTKSVSPLIKQDVLVLTGEDDIDGKARSFYNKQVNILKNAHTVDGRIFTKEENASQHCQAGNIKLALDYIHTWLTQNS